MQQNQSGPPNHVMQVIPKFPCTDVYGKKVSFQAHAMGEFVGGLTEEDRFRGLKTTLHLLYPEFVNEWSIRTMPDGLVVPNKKLSNGWNPWLERMLRAFVNTEYATKQGDNVFRSIVLTGCGGASKTHVAGLFTVTWWLMDMFNSIATLTSTTKDMIGQRIWPVISHYWQNAFDTDTGALLAATGRFGDKLDSQKIIRATKGDDKHAITALAVAHGETQKAIHNLKGRHAPRMLLVVDEANGTPEAIFEIIPNMRKGCKDLTVIIIGNPGSRYDPHGRALTPADGWGSVGEDTYSWLTKGVPEWQLDPGIALRFDGFESPNVKLGKTYFPYMYSYEDKLNALATPGYVGTFNYWVMERGLHPPEGTTRVIFSEQLFGRCLDNVSPLYTFEGATEWLAFLDPAFTSGGDSCWLQFARLGMAGGKMCIQLDDGYELAISPDAAAHDVDYQIARETITACKTRGVKPHCFGLDATAIGRGVGAIIAAEWSSNIIYTQWGGSPSDAPSAQNDGRPGKEVYANKTSELWFRTREALESGQIRGFTTSAMAQACTRLYEMLNKKFKIEPKDDVKMRLRRSPDEFDAICGTVLVAMQNGMDISGKVTETAEREWAKAVTEDPLGLGLTEDSAATTDVGWADESVEMQGTPAWAGE